LAKLGKDIDCEALILWNIFMRITFY
jgi:hypothetical protein